MANFKINGGLTFAGVGGNPREFWEGQAIAFLPRIGLAYQLTPKTVLRTGYGIFYGSIGAFKDHFQPGRLQPVHADRGVQRQRPDL